MGYPNHLIVT